MIVIDTPTHFHSSIKRDDIKPSFFFLQGCAECNCFAPGTIGGLGDCDDKTGQCACKPHVTGRRCQECKDGYYELAGSSRLLILLL